MIMPIYVYGTTVLRQLAPEINPDYEGLDQLIQDMFETMYVSDGVGLAAPQVGLSIRLFIIDASVYRDDEPALANFKKVFINPHIIEKDGEEELIQEGCLSIPHIHEEVLRQGRIRIKYQDPDFKYHDEVYEGMAARIIQHEYDHLDGILFTDHLSPLKRKMLRGKLRDISKGKVSTKYKIVFPINKK